MAHRKAPKRDGNERAIIDALKAVGATVAQIDGTNVPDLVVGYRGVNFLIEVKDIGGKLSKGQYEWHEQWLGQRSVVWNIEQALQVIGALE